MTLFSSDPHAAGSRLWTAVAAIVRREFRIVRRTARGIKKPGSKVVTSATRGVIREDSRTRAEFFAIVEGNRRSV